MRGGNPAGSPLRRTPQAHTGALETQVSVSVCSSRTAAAAHARDRLTVLCARSQQVDDVLMFADHLHHFHFRDEVSPVLLCGIRCTTWSHDISFIRMFYCGTLAGKISWEWGSLFLTFEHFYSHLCETCGFVFVEPNSLGQNHLAEAPFPERLPQRQPDGCTNSRRSQCLHHYKYAEQQSSVSKWLPFTWQLPNRIVGKFVLRHSHQGGGGCTGKTRLANQTRPRLKRGGGLN